MTVFPKKHPFLVLVLLLFFAFNFFIYSILPLNYLKTDPILLSLLVGHSVVLSWIMTFFLGFFNLLLIWFIARHFFNYQVCLLIIFLYSISPWNVIFDLSGSTYVITTFALLLALFGLITLNKNYILGITIYFIGFILLICTSFLFWPTALVILAITLSNRMETSRRKKIILLSPLLIFLLLIFILSRNLAAIKSIFNTQVSVFADVGLINSVNNSRGELRGSGFETIGRIVENRYIYLSEHIFFNILKQFDPWILFSPKIGLFDRSFTSPIMTGFLIPYIIGLSFMVKSLFRQKKFALLILTLILPSILDQKSPNLSKLLVISPFIYTTIALGFYSLLSSLNLGNHNLIFKKKYSKWSNLVSLPIGRRMIKFLLLLIMVTVSIQIFVTLADLMIRESSRLILTL